MPSKTITIAFIVLLSPGCMRIDFQQSAESTSTSSSSPVASSAEVSTAPLTSEGSMGATEGATSISASTSNAATSAVMTSSTSDTSTEESEPPTPGDSTGSTSEDTTPETIPASYCGDGTIDKYEQCDDGESNGSDSRCNNLCQKQWLYAFITSKKYTGDLGDIEGADEKCQTLASSNPKLKNGTYKAWISKRNNNYPLQEVSPKNRFKKCKIAIHTTAEAGISEEQDDILDNASNLAIVFDENGTKTNNKNVWTQTNNSGGLIEPSVFDIPLFVSECGDWKYDFKDNPILMPFQNLDNANAFYGRATDEENQDDGWTELAPMPCTDEAHLYCFEQCPE